LLICAVLLIRAVLLICTVLYRHTVPEITHVRG
jgi:hypothetical protein